MNAGNPWGQPQALPSSVNVTSYSALALLGEQAAPKPLRKDIVAAPVEAVRIWQVVRPTELLLTKARVERMAAAFDEGRNPFAGLFGARLCGVGMNERWDSPVMEATCAHGGQSFPIIALQMQSRYVPATSVENHEAPAQSCSCGVWALKDDDAVNEALVKYNGGSQYAYGRVQLWGRIYEHKRGYRAQYARPVDVTVIDGGDETILGLAAFYGCIVRGGKMPDGVAEHRSSVEQALADYKQQLTAAPLYSSYLTMLGSPPPKAKRWWQG